MRHCIALISGNLSKGITGIFWLGEKTYFLAICSSQSLAIGRILLQ